MHTEDQMLQSSPGVGAEVVPGRGHSKASGRSKDQAVMQGLDKGEVAKVLEFQLQHQSFE